MSGLFEDIEMFDESHKVATRQAVAVANKRFNDQFGEFLRCASTEKEFASRLALVETDVVNMINDVAHEYDGDAQKIKAAVLKTAEEKKEWQKAQKEVQIADEHSQVPPWLKKQIQDEDQEDGGNLRNKEAAGEINSQPVANPVPLAEQPGIGGNIEEQLEGAPSAVGTGKAAGSKGDHLLKDSEDDETGEHKGIKEIVEEKYPESKDMTDPQKDKFFGQTPSGDLTKGIDPEKFTPWDTKKDSAAHTVEEKGDEFVVVEGGGEEAAGPFDSKEKAQARAKELNELENLEKEAARKTASTCPECNEQSFPDGYGCLNGNCSTGARADREVLHHAVDNYGTPVTQGGIRGPFHYDPEAAKNPTNLNYALPQYEKEIAQMRSQNPGMGMTTEQDLRPTAAMNKALALKEAATQGKKRNFFAAKPETGDSTEKNESLPTGNEDAHDGPSPKMDKKKWKPNATNPDGNLKPIETEGEHSPHPTRKMDIKEKPDYQNDDPWENDNNVWEREQLPTATKDEAGFEGTRNIDQPTKAAETFPDKGQTNPVTKVSLPDALAEKKVATQEKVAVFEDERDIIEQNIPDDYTPFPGFWKEMADLKRKGISDQVIQDLLYGSWRTEQDPEFLESIGITPLRDASEWKSEEELEREDRARKMLEEESEAPLAPKLSPEDALAEALAQQTSEEPVVEEEIEIEEAPEEIEEIIERGDHGNDRVEVIHKEDEEEDFLDNLEGPSDEDLKDEEDDLEQLMREAEENPDDYA